MKLRTTDMEHEIKKYTIIAIMKLVSKSVMRN